MKQKYNMLYQQNITRHEHVLKAIKLINEIAADNI